MINMLFASIMLLGVAGGFTLPGDDFALLREERIGTLRIHSSEREARRTIHCGLKRGPEELWGADGAYHQEWMYVDCGLTLGMVSKNKGAPKSIESITVVSPSALCTRRGIRIGSTAQEVMTAYKSAWNKEESTPGSFVAGSLCGGLLIQFENGTVSRIFLGAAAE